jgi:hypothetical protein
MPKRERILLDPVAPEWKVKDMIKKLGGVGGVTEKLMAKGFSPPGVDTIQGWASRGSVPGAWAPALFALAQDEGYIESPMDALIRDSRLQHKSSRK